MFDVGASEFLLIVIVAIVVIGPKDLPVALRTAGRWIAKVRRVSGYFRSGIETMIREAELEEMEKKWREQNEAIMKANPQTPGAETSVADAAEPALPPPSLNGEPLPQAERERAPIVEGEPQLPLPPP
jgi:sec-independent protein translocase protein TatB